MPQAGQFSVTLSGTPAQRLMKAHKAAQKEFHKLHPNIELSLAGFVADMALCEIERRGYLKKARRSTK